MIEFNVCLTRLDLKKFIFSRIKMQPAVYLLPPLTYLGLAFLISFVSLFIQVQIVVFIVVLFLLFMGFFYFYKTFLMCRKMFLQGLELVGKKRNFFIDNWHIQILCETDDCLCGRYFFYDLKNFFNNKDYFILLFAKKIYIIIPKRCLEHDQIKDLNSVLNKAKN